jgi:hypothetical protein
MNIRYLGVRTSFVRRATLLAAASAAAAASISVQAAIVDSGPVNLPVTANIDGLYLNVVTGASANGPVAGWDFNPYANATNLTFFTSTTAANVNAVVGAAGVITALTPGATVGPANTFISPGNATTTGTAFRQTGTAYAGIRFTNEAGGTVHYGYVEMTTTAGTGFPAVVTRYVYDNTPNTAVTIAGGTVAPTFAYTPATGSTVGFVGGTNVGTTGTGTITVALGTPAGSGTGAAATTTLTCTAPTAPFTGFAQTITAVGNGAISGTTLSGTCTLGAAAVTQTLTCNENRGGTANARTWTLSCPAGTVPPTPITSVPATGATINLPARPLGGPAATGSVVFTNPGTSAVALTCTISGAGAAAFSSTNLNPSVAAGGSATVPISYTSATVGTATATLTCTGNAQTFTYTVNGATVQQALSVPTLDGKALLLMLALVFGFGLATLAIRRT